MTRIEQTTDRRWAVRALAKAPCRSFQTFCSIKARWSCLILRANFMKQRLAGDVRTLTLFTTNPFNMSITPPTGNINGFTHAFISAIVGGIIAVTLGLLATTLAAVGTGPLLLLFLPAILAGVVTAYTWVIIGAPILAVLVAI